jgi:hypothetical protein
VIKAKFIKSGYTTEKFNDFINNEVKVPSLINHAWTYVESDIIKALDENHVILIRALKAINQKYIN